ncbi:hypothetical protein FO519_010040 [Halicephalobus sp. NKZ332]|nr:hypothetical protein FO519_010040 [Halicephalobus sp. NKZ332]
MTSNSSPIVELTRVETFSASHRLYNPELSEEVNKENFGKCTHSNGHGHNYKWEVTLRGHVNPDTGIVYNLYLLKKEMAAVLEIVDHKNLDVDVDYFRPGRNVSTTENVAIFLYNSLKQKMKTPELLHKVVVYSTDKNYATYRG